MDRWDLSDSHTGFPKMSLLIGQVITKITKFIKVEIIDNISTISYTYNDRLLVINNWILFLEIWKNIKP